MAKNGNGNWPLNGRCNYGGGMGTAIPDHKMSRRRRSQWPYFNRDSELRVNSAMRDVLKRRSARKRRQRDRPEREF